MARPLLFNNRLNAEDPGDGAAEDKGAEAWKGRNGEGEGGKERASHNTPSHPTAETAAGNERANRPERGEWRRIRSPRGQRRATKRTERPHGGTG